jgi:hypothetical protein
MKARIKKKLAKKQRELKEARSALNKGLKHGT